MKIKIYVIYKKKTTKRLKNNNNKNDEQLLVFNRIIAKFLWLKLVSKTFENLIQIILIFLTNICTKNIT